jgi:hypothetical protein
MDILSLQWWGGKRFAEETPGILIKLQSGNITGLILQVKE